MTREFPFETQWFLNGEEVTSGTATLRIWKWEDGTRKYLQADGSFNVTSHAFTMSHDGSAWVRPTSVPVDEHLTAERTHSDSRLVQQVESFQVHVDAVVVGEEHERIKISFGG